MSKPQKKPVPAAKRMSQYRARLRAAGLKPVTLWLPDTKSPAFIAEMRRQSLAIAAHDPGGDEILKWIEDVYEWPRA
jgi:Protein  of unknown function (DUF3018)